MYLESRKQVKKRRIVCLEWDGRMLRVVEALVGKKGVRLLKVLSLLIPADVDASDAQALGQWIRRALDEQEVSAKLAVVDVPRNQAILTTLNLPVSVPGELPGMVEFQITKELPFPLSEAVVDFAVPRNAGQPTAPVLVAAVRNEVIEHLTSVITAAGMKLEGVGLRPFASRTAVMRSLGEGMAERVLFVDVGPTMTEIDVIAPDSLPFSRAADVFVPGGLGETQTFNLGAARSETPTPRPASDEPSRLYSLESVTESLVLEVTRSVEAYRARERGQRIGHAVIAGSMGVEEALCEALQQRFDFTVEVYNPAATFGWSAEDGAAATGFASVLGLVLGHDVDPVHHFDFLHPKRTVTQAEVQLRRAPRLLAWSAALVVTATLVYWTSINDDLRRKAALERAIAELEEDKSEKEEFIKLVRQFQDYDARQPRWLDEFVQLASLLPDNRDWVIGDVRMDAAERKIVFESRFCDPDGKGYKLPFSVAEDIEAYRRPGATRPRYKVDLQQLSRNLTNTKYPLKQQLAVFLREDGAPPVVPRTASEMRASSKPVDPQPEAPSASPRDGAPSRGVTARAGDAAEGETEKKEAAPANKAAAPAEDRPVNIGRSPALPARPPVSTRPTAPGGVGARPVSGVRTDASGKPLAPEDEKGRQEERARDPQVPGASPEAVGDNGGTGVAEPLPR